MLSDFNSKLFSCAKVGQMTEKSSAGNGDIIELTVEIVASHVQNNSVAISDLPELIKTVHESLTGLTI